MMRPAYLLVTLALALGAWWVTRLGSGLDPVLVATGLVVAWVIQAVGFWTLTAALERGGSALGPWVGGMAARAAGLVVLWLIALGAGLPGIDLVATYAFALLAFLLLEAAWLAVGGGNLLHPRKDQID